MSKRRDSDLVATRIRWQIAGVISLLSLGVAGSPSAYQPIPIVPDSTGVEASIDAKASFESVRGYNNWLTTRICNQNFYTVSIPGDVGDEKLLLLETSTGHTSLPQECVFFSFELSAWPLNDVRGKPIWTINSQGAGSEIAQAGYREWFYKTWSPSISEDWGMISYFDLMTGRELVTAGASILAIVQAGGREWRFVTLDCDLTPEGMGCGLRYVRSDATEDSLSIAGVSNWIGLSAPKLRFVREGGRSSDSEVIELDGWNLADDGLRPGHFSIQVCLVNDTLLVPVRGDRFDRPGTRSSGTMRVEQGK